jgi:hypothetical protein
MLTSIAGLAAAEDQLDTDDVEVKVTISELDGGVLAMSVDDDETTLAESGSTALVRQFTGALPTVTVTDTRDPDDIPAGVFWYVLGSASDFEGDDNQPDISAKNLGWAPELDASVDPGEVMQGDPVGSLLDLDPTDPDYDDDAELAGLIDAELLAMAWDSATAAPTGEWSATADLTLKTEATVAAGNYTSTLTLSLFE